MKRSWLIQHMQKPTGRGSSMGFGGGGSGFSKDTEEQFKDVCDWYYMGACEYELGSTAEALNRMIKGKKKLKARAFKVRYKYDRRAWGFATAKLFEGEGKVFFLCPKKDAEEVQERITEWAIDYVYGNTRDRVNLEVALAGEGSEYSKCCGWFDIDNDFMFFTDEKMWREFCDGFSVKVPSKKQMSKI